MNQDSISPKISVIVPLFHTEPCLKRCLDSLQQQTFSEIEVLMIDDGSADGSGAICDAYAASDPRFIAIHRRHEGVSAARNCGLDLAKAEYIMFADSDDWVEPDFCRIPYETAVKENADMVIFRFEKLGFRHGNKISAPLPEGSVSKKEALAMLVDGRTGNYLWNRCFHRSLFSTIRFPEGMCYEDIGTLFRVVSAASAIVVSNAMLYHYELRNGSIITQRTEKALSDEYRMNLQLIDGLKELGYHDLSYQRLIQLSMQRLIRYGRTTNRLSALADRLRKDYRFGKASSKKQELLLLLLKVSPPLFDLVCVLSGRRKTIKQAE